MKKIIILVLFLLLPRLASATDELMLNAVNKSLIEYESKNSQCIASSKMQSVSDDLIQKVKQVETDLSISIGYLYKNSLYQCSLHELSTLMKLFLLVENSEKEEYPLTKLRVNEIKKLLFTKVDLRFELKFQNLPNEKQLTLTELGKSLAPFDLLDMYERAQD
ncbi:MULTISPECIES: hypothetical protein [Vibrio harveyi group]|nr:MULTISPECIES: hypothetical protein [Vibrio harveyi group]ELA9340459.1 hypothetical protein [Vibrio parahaemolyticus]MBE3696207.1 hypothetical protein [Vibrio parahaemolyticus]MBM4819396.1 hypothetical protein [Vibrio parahaemolyticus]MBS9866922.1 hypothetical protein [Vibrio alginolyticus]MBS9890028.1 hypothetical protein [Vibrio alginolyticus]